MTKVSSTRARRPAAAGGRERRDKLGFVTPEVRFLRGPLGDLVEETLSSRAARSRGFVDVDEALRRSTHGAQRRRRAASSSGGQRASSSGRARTSTDAIAAP